MEKCAYDAVNKDENYRKFKNARLIDVIHMLNGEFMTCSDEYMEKIG